MNRVKIEMLYKNAKNILKKNSFKPYGIISVFFYDARISTGYFTTLTRPPSGEHRGKGA